MNTLGMHIIFIRYCGARGIFEYCMHSLTRYYNNSININHINVYYNIQVNLEYKQSPWEIPPQRGIGREIQETAGNVGSK
jgi:hypothetical protein